MSKLSPSTKFTIGIIAVLSAAACAYLFLFGYFGYHQLPHSYIDYKLTREAETLKKLHFNLVDPGQAPEHIRTLAKLGFDIMLDTKKYALAYVHDKLNCTSCHFSAGDTLGGSQNGISLAGVGAKYPVYDKRLEKVIDLPTRINNCFLRSMNGKALPLDSELMLALVTYLQWISKDIPIYSKIPWLGLKPLTTSHVGDSVQGQRIYNKYCALCHRDDGQGGSNNPPLWGEGSFNHEAGMNKIDTLAAFIYWNMPYDDTTPVLTEAEAMDVAAYILAQPRA